MRAYLRVPLFLASLVMLNAGLHARTAAPLLVPGAAEIIEGADQPELIRAMTDYPDAFRKAGRLYEAIAGGAFSPDRAAAGGIPVDANFYRGTDAGVAYYQAVLMAMIGGKEVEQSVFAGTAEALGDAVAQALIVFWAELTGYAPPEGARPPLYLSSISSSSFSPFLGLNAMYRSIPMAITGIAPGGEGRNYLSFMSILTGIVDPLYRIVAMPGRQAFDVEYKYMGGYLASTSSGVAYASSGLAPTLYRFYPGAPAPEAVPTGSVTQIYQFSVMDDGAVLVPDYGRSAIVRVKKGEGIRNIPLSPSAMEAAIVGAMSTGPGDTLWVLTSQKRVLVLDRDGRMQSSVRLLIGPDEYFSPQAMRVAPDGSMYFIDAAGLARFDKFGRRAWLLGWDEVRATMEPRLKYVNSLSFNPASGVITLYDSASNIILDLFDDGYARAAGLKDPAVREALAMVAGLPREPRAALRAKAAFYESKGSLAGAYDAWMQLDFLGDGDAAGKIEALQSTGLMLGARILRQSLLDALDAYPVSKCAPLYSSVVGTYDEYLMAHPADADALREKQAVMELFALRSGTKPAAGGPHDLLIKGAKIDNLFPSLMFWYKANPSATVTVANTGEARIEGAKLLITIPDCMDAPSESAPFSVDPGKELAVPVKLLLGAKVLGFEEDRAYKAKVELQYSSKGAPGADSATADVTIYRKTALNWSDTSRLASFITPNEETISAFAHRSAATGAAAPLVGARIARAARVVDALGAYGMAYIEDPASPFSAALGKAEVVDTVRFPRDTLRYKSGDCDDTTALLASMLESVGVGTAILTVPGHVFLAFDSGEAPESRWLFTQAPYQAIERDGTLWIPVETTVMSQGFAEAWRVAGGLVAEHRDALEFLPVAALRAAYPALPLPASPFVVVEPAPGAVDAADAKALARLDAAVYAPLAAKLEAAAKAQKGRPLAKALNQLAVLRLRFGRDADAIKDLTSALAAAPDYEPAFINLAQAYMARGDLAKAGETAKAGLAARADSAPLKALYADALARAGRTDPSIKPGAAGGAGLAATADAGETGRGAPGGFAPSWVTE